uniref:protein DD3-3-like n=1 Tax=Styela clava TaxID=7725 RepID=UPI001939DA4F|nr:protein DD3-3-like [Styela clava]
MQLAYFFTLLLCIGRLCNGDMYMHNPRGCNNRLNEESATRTNNNRIFNSQNNNRGGYNVGDKNPEAATNQEQQYSMEYFQSSANVRPGTDSLSGRSELVVQWTNQHGCGGNEDTDPHKLNCNIVLQYLCQDDVDSAALDDGFTLRNGISTDSQNYNNIASTSTKADFDARKNQDAKVNRAVHEPWWSYDACNKRERNKGLFVATQNLEQRGAVSTRQNPGGDRSGWECPEERDYFPYWHPTVFTDAAILAQNESMCEYYKQHSFNRAPKSLCVEEFSAGVRKHFSDYSTKESCEANSHSWVEYYQMLELAPKYTSQGDCEKDHGDGLSYKWGKPFDPNKIENHQPIVDTCFVQPPEIDCKAADWSRVNHLGNGRAGHPLNYTWVLPHYPSGNKKRCILRARYNITTDDYDPWNTFASNGENKIQQNPLVDVAEGAQSLRLAINTAQFGRTFQDRTHVFKLAPRPSNFDADARVLNLNVRGKRGNIVQTFPAVEYDFYPTRFSMRKGLDYLHVQWTGSNTHKNGGPGGDGQTGSAGEGKDNTDRHNLLQTIDTDVNYPLPWETMTMFKDATVMWVDHGDITLAQSNIEVFLATAGYYHCLDGCSKSLDGVATPLQRTLDNANPSFHGIVVKFESTGEYYYICTRNNNFTNRSQKGKLTIKEA